MGGTYPSFVYTPEAAARSGYDRTEGPSLWCLRRSLAAPEAYLGILAQKNEHLPRGGVRHY